jgi:hypothetical protein
MRLSRRATLLVAFYLLTSAATAHAACAWVLWEEQYVKSGDSERIPIYTDTTTWTIRVAFEKRDECERARQAAWKVTLADLQERRGGRVESALGTAIFLPEGVSRFTRSERYTYTCLPDTIDPRGPKGGTR